MKERMATETIPPALTPEEWRIALHEQLAADGGIDVVRRKDCEMWRHDGGEVGVREYNPYGNAHVLGTDLHALAALALYGQPFGFTQDDVNGLGVLRQSLEDADQVAVLDSVIARLAALLPEESP